MYFESISFIYKVNVIQMQHMVVLNPRKQMKGRPLSVTSPLLYSISQVQSWKKINSGLLQMYQVHFLSVVSKTSHSPPARVFEQVSYDAALPLREYFAVELALLAKIFSPLLLHICNSRNIATSHTNITRSQVH